jgi:hypothetical protein
MHLMWSSPDGKTLNDGMQIQYEEKRKEHNTPENLYEIIKSPSANQKINKYIIYKPPFYHYLIVV